MSAPANIPAIELLAARLKPYVCARLKQRRNYDQPVPVVDIHVPGWHYIDADIRSMDADGIHIFTGCSCDVVPWDDVRKAVFRDYSSRTGEVFDIDRHAAPVGVAA